ncbi:MAG: ribosomal-processing cysteine protease Prp [Firmicutes bacterium]|nr:ribosomal-processing cysteine protease Prp [Bacillota bacterium]
MIKIQVLRDKEGFIWEFEIKGHSGFGQQGEDIVCAGVSALGYTAVGALAELAGIESYAEKEGYIRCSIPEDVKEDLKPIIRIILETVVIGLKQIENSYREYVVIKEQEV